MSEPLPPVPGVVKAVVEGVTSFAKNWFNLFYFFYTGTAPNSTTLATMATSIYDEFVADFAPLMPPSTEITATSVTDLSTEMSPTITHTQTSPGTSTADKLPANVATLINYTVGMRYRGGHPRNYLYCGTDENLLNESQWNTAYIATAGTAITDFINDIVPSTFGGTDLTEHVMVSYFGGAPTVDGKSVRRVTPLVLPILGQSVNPIVGSQRRRRGMR
jgi:hypothetical protein